jgi:hypothetical protein
MSATIVKIRRTVASDGTPSFTFAVDGLPQDDQTLSVSQDTPPVSDFIALKGDPGAARPLIETAGHALLDDLNRHKNMSHALQSTRMSPVGATNREIRIEIAGTAKAAHGFPWEALFDTNFIALNDQIPINRIIPASSARTSASFGGKLKILAIVAAAGVPGEPECKAIQKALTQWSGDCEYKLLVDTSEAATAAGAAASLVPDTAEELISQIGDFGPHILHIFCHGQSDGGGVLEIANELATKFGANPLFVTAGKLTPALQTTWLVSLNACATGEVNPATDTSSFACTLVDQGTPFVTSMRQEVVAGVAHVFAEAFLSKALSYLDGALKNGPVDLCFGDALTAARDRIAAFFGNPMVMAPRIKDWTLPILCAASVPFKVTPVPIEVTDAPTTLANITLLQRALDLSGWSAEERAKIVAQIASLKGELAGG